MKSPLSKDSVASEVRAIKEQLSAKFNDDIVAMLRDSQRREARSGHRLVPFQARPAKPLADRLA